MDQQGSTQSDPPPPISSSTGLEEPMWQLGLGGGTGSNDPNPVNPESEQPESYPERPGEPDCIFFLRTGFCGYGDRCRFNHPRHRSRPPQVPVEVEAVEGDHPERPGQPICQYFVRTGACKFGSSCKYHHPRQGGGSTSPFALNIYGYPLRPGEKECSYYMRTGQCKFGMTCKFHHPQPANVQMPSQAPSAVPSPAPVASPAGYPSVHTAPTPPQHYGMITSNWPMARPPMVPGSYVQGPYGSLVFSPGMVPFPGWPPYPVPGHMTAPSAQSAVGGGQLYGITTMSPLASAYAGPYPVLSTPSGSNSVSKEHTYPQRPGQPECQYYLKTGDCKFGSSCKYHHPPEWIIPESSSALSPMGLPLRPGTPTCSYYAHHGVCKFGPTCKFDHPMGTLSYSPSASSLSDMPVAPYPVGSLIGTLAPSSSSSDLRAEVISRSNQDSPPILSGGSVLSKSGSSLSGVQQSMHSQAASISSSNKTGTPRI